MKELHLYHEYCRQDVCQIFAPLEKFTQSAGRWGLHGIISLKPDNPNDFVFFVTLGRIEGSHTFVEGITEEGILIWQSQPKQKLSDKIITKLINHDSSVNNIHLFIRKLPQEPYVYLGLLAYITHDSSKEQPVNFKWKLLDWDGDESIKITEFSDHKINTNSTYTKKKNEIKLKTPPKNYRARTGAPTNSFSSRVIDFVDENNKKNKLGLSGESLALDYEKKYLIKNGRVDLADKVVHISRVQGDGAGYDILSFDLKGKSKYIEVKTTTGGLSTHFFISKRELNFSNVHSDSYFLYRIFNYKEDTNCGDMYILQGRISDLCQLEPTQYKVFIK